MKNLWAGWLLEDDLAAAFLGTTPGLIQSSAMFVITAAEAFIHDGTPRVDTHLELREITSKSVEVLDVIAPNLPALARPVHGILQLPVLLGGTVPRRILGGCRVRGLTREYEQQDQ